MLMKYTDACIINPLLSEFIRFRDSGATSTLNRLIEKFRREFNNKGNSRYRVVLRKLRHEFDKTTFFINGSERAWRSNVS